jgi:hypothetical protein
MKIHSDGCNNLRYGVNCDEKDGAVEIAYSFLNGIPFDDGLAVQLVPHTERRLYHPSRKTPTDPQPLRQMAEQAEYLFTHELGDAIRAAIQMLSHDIAGRVGLIPIDAGAMGELLANGYKTDRSARLGITPGAKKGRRHLKTATAISTFERDLEKLIITISRDGEVRPNSTTISRRMHVGKKTLQLRCRAIGIPDLRRFIRDTLETLDKE